MFSADWDMEICVFQVQRRKPLNLPDALYHHPCVDHLEWQHFQISVQRPEVENGPMTAIYSEHNKIFGVKPSVLCTGWYL